MGDLPCSLPPSCSAVRTCPDLSWSVGLQKFQRLEIDTNEAGLSTGMHACTQVPDRGTLGTGTYHIAIWAFASYDPPKVAILCLGFALITADRS
jgi:hypothetical protein